MGRVLSVEVAGAMTIFFDIETVPPEESVRGRVLEEVKHEVKEGKLVLSANQQVDQVADERFRRLALCGEEGRVLVVGMIVERGGETVKRCLIGCDQQRRFHMDEARTIRGFWAALRDFDCGYDLLVGHNVLDFDLMFLYKRSVIFGVRPTVNFPAARYRSRPVYDTMCEWERWGRGRVGLGRLAVALRLESSKTAAVNGANVYDNFIAGRHEEIADYCGRDVELVRAVYHRMLYSDVAGGR
ncbi:MAG TPA: hypothetical protein VF611_01610 [Pyrinomonadaceae bacterium]